LARSHIDALEKRVFNPRLSTLGALAKAFKIRTADLLLPPQSPKTKKVGR
jgi:hypothetical protein